MQAGGETIVVAGARPNFVRVAPVLHALCERGVPYRRVHTGQHYDTEMSDVFFEELAIEPPDFHLNVGSGMQEGQTARIMLGFEEVVSEVVPDSVIYFGHVNSTLACSLVAAKAGVCVVHIGAGLRIGGWSMREELDRDIKDWSSVRLSACCFGPSEYLCHESAANSQFSSGRPCCGRMDIG